MYTSRFIPTLYLHLGRKTQNFRAFLFPLYIAAKEKSDKELTEFCVNELKKIASMDTRDYLLASPIVCHGLSGAALIFKRMYQETKDEVFYANVNSKCEKN